MKEDQDWMARHRDKAPPKAGEIQQKRRRYTQQESSAPHSSVLAECETGHDEGSDREGQRGGREAGCGEAPARRLESPLKPPCFLDDNYCTRLTPATSWASVIVRGARRSRLEPVPTSGGRGEAATVQLIGTSANTGCCVSRERAVRIEKFRCAMILAAWLNNNLAAGISEDSKSTAPSFRAADGKHKVLTPASLGPPFDAPDDETPAGGCRPLGSVLPPQLLRHRWSPISPIRTCRSKTYESPRPGGRTEYCREDFDKGDVLRLISALALG